MTEVEYDVAKKADLYTISIRVRTSNRCMLQVELPRCDVVMVSCTWQIHNGILGKCFFQLDILKFPHTKLIRIWRRHYTAKACNG